MTSSLPAASVELPYPAEPFNCGECGGWCGPVGTCTECLEIFLGEDEGRGNEPADEEEAA